jgi:NAD(P)H-hydrate epimerase
MITAMKPGQQNSFTDDAALVEASLAECTSWLPVRNAESHKASNGRVLITGGEQSMAGAVSLAGWSACIAGAGLVRIATIPDNVASITCVRPELLVNPINNVAQLRELLTGSDCHAIGPGLGQTDWSRDMFEFSLEHGRPSVIDADGLNLLAQAPEKRADWVLTPHPGEAARLLKCKARDIQQDRLSAAREIVDHYGGVCILKGKDSLVASHTGPAVVCRYGNEALAVAGTGDVLAGLLAGLLAQGMDQRKAAITAVVLHASAADRHAEMHGVIGMLASDLFLPLRQLRNAAMV